MQMRKWFGFFLVFVLTFTSILSYADNNMGSHIVTDWYQEFARVFGNFTSIEQAIVDQYGNNDHYAEGVSYSPAFMIETEEYLLQVIEIWSDGTEIYANFELSLKSECGIIRPYEWSLQNSCYYTPISQYEVPVYYFYVDTGLTADEVSQASSWGIDSSNQTMNRIQYKYINDEIKAKADDVLLYLRVVIERQKDGLTLSDTYCFSLPCPKK